VVARLTCERARELLEYRDGKLFWRKRSHAKGNDVVGARAGAVCGKYRRIGIDGRRYLEHRVVWLVVHGTWPSQQIGTAHVVIALNDAIVWDPALDDSGIVGPADDGYYWIEFLVPAQILAEAAHG
jgi:hypothetical protein